MIKIALVTAIIHRDMAEKVPRIVPMHEIPILELVHGKNVEVDEKNSPNMGPKKFDPQEEYERLIKLYGEEPKSGLPYVERVYGRVHEFAQVLERMAAGEPLGGDDLDDIDLDDGLVGGDGPQTAKLEDLTKAELLDIADQMGLKGAAQLNKADLIVKIQQTAKSAEKASGANSGQQGA